MSTGIDVDDAREVVGCFLSEGRREPIVPVVHGNGTSRGVLLNGYKAARHAIKKAIEALKATAPNARDYYIISPDAFAEARSEFDTRLESLERIDDDLRAISMAVFKQGM